MNDPGLDLSQNPSRFPGEDPEPELPSSRPTPSPDVPDLVVALALESPQRDHVAACEAARNLDGHARPDARAGLLVEGERADECD
jgi:hypothetical protein